MHLQMIPLLRVDHRFIQFGPFRADAETGEVVAVPWPEGMDRLFPQGWRIMKEPSWTPFDYCPSREGGVWAVLAAPQGQDREGKPEPVLLFLNGRGEIREHVRLPESLPEVRHPLYVSGEWTIAFNQILRGMEIVGDVASLGDDAVMHLQEGLICLRPDGALLFPGGMAFHPDGLSFRIFSDEDLRRVVRKASGIKSRSNVRSSSRILGWSDDGLWVLCEAVWVSEIPGRFLFSVVRLHNVSRNPAAEVVWLREYRTRYVDVMPRRLHDDGWVIQIRAEPVSPENPVTCLFHPPGGEGVVELSLPAGGPESEIYGVQFSADREGNLLAVLQEDANDPDQDPDLIASRIWLWMPGEGGGRRFHVLTSHALPIRKESMEGGWMSLPGGGPGPAGDSVLLRSSLMLSAPPGALTLRSLGDFLDPHGMRWITHVIHIIPSGDFVLVHAIYPVKAVFATMRFRRGVPRIIRRIDANIPFDQLLAVDEGPDFTTAVFLDMDNPSRKAALFLSGDASMSASIIA